MTPLLCSCEPSREQYRDDLAMVRCEREERCGNLGNYGGTFEDCLIEETANANQVWPEADCGGGRIDDELALACYDEVRTWSCTGLDSLGDLGRVLDVCQADRVCVDPPN